MGSKSRRKGHDWERSVAEMFRQIGIRCERNLEFQTGHLNRDLAMPHFNTQLKCYERLGMPVIREGWGQAVAGVDAEHPVALLIVKENERKKGNLPPLAVLRLDEFLNLIKEWKDGHL